jgi:hypothetical protein
MVGLKYGSSFFELTNFLMSQILDNLDKSLKCVHSCVLSNNLLDMDTCAREHEVDDNGSY